MLVTMLYCLLNMLYQWGHLVSPQRVGGGTLGARDTRVVVVVAPGLSAADTRWFDVLPFAVDKVELHAGAAEHPTASYFAYIVSHYERLPERLVFLCDYSRFDHGRTAAAHALTQLAGSESDNSIPFHGFASLNRAWTQEPDMRYNTEAESLSFWQHQVKRVWANAVPASRSAARGCLTQFVVSRELILRHPRALYEHLGHLLTTYGHVVQDLPLHALFGEPVASCTVLPVPTPLAITALPPMAALIVEPRQHELLEHVIGKFAVLLPEAVQLVWHHGRSVEIDSYPGLKALAQSGRLKTVRMGVDSLNGMTYSKYMMTAPVWRSVGKAEKVLVFQLDSAGCARSPFGLPSFSHLDYVGSFKPISFGGYGVPAGNGGLSLRDVGLSRRCAQLMDTEQNQFGQLAGNEDSLFTTCIRWLGGREAGPTEQQKFGTEDVFAKESFGGHKVRAGLERGGVSFEEYCPEYLYARKRH